MSVKERIKEYIKFEEITTVEFEKKINVGNGYINNISKGIGDDKIKMILENYPNLNFDWLFTGRGEMLRNSSKSDEKCKVCVSKDEHIKSLNSQIEKMDRYINGLIQIKKQSEMVAETAICAAVG